MSIKVKSGWSTLKGGVDIWLPELRKLIVDASVSANAQNINDRLDAAAYFNGFIQESFPQTPEMTELDDLAAQTATDLMNAVIDERLAAISARTADFLKLEKAIASAADEATAAADSIRLKSIRTCIDSATQTIESAKALVDSLDNPDADEQAVITLINKTVDAVEKLRSSVAGLI